MRIAVKLVDAVEGAQIWAERFDGDMEDVFALQDEVAIAVGGQIASNIEAADIRRANARPTPDLTAYDLFLRAVFREREFDKPAMLDALSLLEQALERDPHYARALAHAGLVHSFLRLQAWTDDPEQARMNALDFSQRALQAGSDDYEVLAVVSSVLLWVGDDAAVADAMVERALAANPGASLIWWTSAWVKLFDGRPTVALDHWRAHLRLDPRSPYQALVTGGVGFARVLLGEWEVAVPFLREAIQNHPKIPAPRIALAVACARLGQMADATSTLQGVTKGAIQALLETLRKPENRETIRSGLALAGADV